MRNGTQKELDLSKDDARKLPTDAFFMIRGREVKAMRLNDELDDAESVFFIDDEYIDIGFLRASDLEVVNEN